MRSKLYLVILLSFVFLQIFAQRQEDSTLKTTNAIIPIHKQNLLKNIDVIANMQWALNNYFQDGKYTMSKFENNQFRLEIRGKITDRVSFRFRDRYTKVTEPGSLDNISRSTDIASITVKLSKKWDLTMGKMCADWGGYEFDANPIDIYQYNDIVEYADNFLTGVLASYTVNERHQFSFQLMNSRTQSYHDLYDTVPGVTPSKFPVAANINWRGSFADGKFQTIWSYSQFLEAKNQTMFYIAMGNQLKLNKILLQYDFKWSNEQLDRTTLVNQMVPDNILPYAALNTRYVEHWLHFNFQPQKKLNLFVIGMVSDAFWYGNPDPNKSAHLRTAWGLIPGAEYFPFNDLNLKFFATYIGRFYRYTDYAKKTFGDVNTNTARISVGFICPLLIL